MFYNNDSRRCYTFTLDASRSSPVYGASDTVQPPALTLLPCIKAFDAATNPGLIDITGLANEVDGKLDRVIDSKPVRYVIDAYNDGTNWYRKWSDGWVEQGGQVTNIAGGVKMTLLIAMANNAIHSRRHREKRVITQILSVMPRLQQIPFCI